MKLKGILLRLWGCLLKGKLMPDRNGNPVLPGSVVYEVGSTGSVPPLIVLADGRLLSLGNVNALDDFPAGILPAGEISEYDLEVVDPDKVDFASYSTPDPE